MPPEVHARDAGNFKDTAKNAWKTNETNVYTDIELLGDIVQSESVW